MNLKRFHHELQEWYDQHGRKSLPWRNTDDPYAIWVSEVMLQQTQVSTVLERYYFPFLEAFPTVEALAGADLQEVLKRWEGLGYYRRARNLHAAAQRVDSSWFMVDRKKKNHQPSPINHQLIEHLLSLPGVGRNTAHAVAAFAFHQPVPVMEANVKRVLSRVFALGTPSEKELWALAEVLLDRDNPFDYNQAMMDIGATVCTKTKPKCGMCPAASICTGKEKPEAYPAKKAKKQTPVRRAVIYAFYDNQGRYLVRRREGEFLHGLWGFVESEVAEPRTEKIGSIKQVYSHFTLEADVIRLPGKGQLGVWKPLDEIETLPLSRADQKVVVLLKRLCP